MLAQDGIPGQVGRVQWGLSGPLVIDMDERRSIENGCSDCGGRADEGCRFWRVR